MSSHRESLGILQGSGGAVLATLLAMFLLSPVPVSPAPQANELPAPEWRLEVVSENQAELEFLTGPKRTVRMEIRRAVTGVPWHIRAGQGPFAVSAGEPYSLRFRARADGVRTIGASVMQTRPPFETLGRWVQYELTPVWRTFEGRFVFRKSAEAAWIQFTIGANRYSVEISDLSLVRVADGENLLAEPNSPSGAGGD